MTEEQAKKEIVVTLRALRVILNPRPKWPRQRYPDGLYQHPKVKKLQAKIEALVPHLAALDPPGGPYFRDFLPCDVLPLTQLPAHWEILRELDQYIEDFGGEQKADSDGPWSKPDTPSRWARLFGVSPRTFKRYVEQGKIRGKKLSDRSYHVHVEDVPQQKPAPAPDHKLP